MPAIFCGLKSIVNQAGYLTTSEPHSYIYDMADDYLLPHKMLMDYMNKSAR
jgi:hypothetical protein